MALRSWCKALAPSIRRAALISLALFGLMMAAVASAQIPQPANALKKDALAAWRSVWGLTGPTASLAAQVHQESAWNVNARSRVGAMGLTQFMPATAKDVQARYAGQFAGLTMYSPVWAFKAQALYMKELYGMHDAANLCEKMAFTMASYNGGAGWTNKRKKLSPQPKVCFGVTCDINPGILPANQKENAEYPRRILLSVEPRYVAALWGSGSCPKPK